VAVPHVKMAAADVADKTGDEIAQELLEADIALGHRMRAKQLLHQLQCSDELVPVKAPLEAELRKLVEERGQSCIPGYHATTPRQSLALQLITHDASYRNGTFLQRGG